MDDKGQDNIKNSQGASVLVAEREPVARSSLSELFRYEGYRVFEAPDANSAIEQINNNLEINVIMTDLEMPQWSSIIEHARSTVPNAFILTMAGYGSVPNALEAQQLGAHGYFLKPLVFADMHGAICNLLTGRPIS